MGGGVETEGARLGTLWQLGLERRQLKRKEWVCSSSQSCPRGLLAPNSVSSHVPLIYWSPKSQLLPQTPGESRPSRQQPPSSPQPCLSGLQSKHRILGPVPGLASGVSPKQPKTWSHAVSQWLSWGGQGRGHFGLLHDLCQHPPSQSHLRSVHRLK